MVFVSGCTALNSSQSESTPVAASALSADTAIHQSTQQETIVSFASWSDLYPDYDEQTKQKLIEDAEEEILRVFPDVDSSSLEGKWEEETYGTSCIVFNNVDDTSEAFLEMQKIRFEGAERNIHDNIVTIKVDPYFGNIIEYGTNSLDWPLKSEKRTVSFNEVDDKSLDFVSTVKGDQFVEEKKDDFYLYTYDSDSGRGNGLSYITFFNTFNGVQYLYDRIFVRYDMIQDKVFSYEDELRDSEFMKSLTTLSSDPTIGLSEAKRILEGKLQDNYPGEDLDIQYTVLNGHENALNWYDTDEAVYSSNPEPIKLIWYISFSDRKMRNEDARKTTTAIVDAHTGDVISLNYRDINIS